LITAPFTYKRAASVGEALGLAEDNGDEAKFLAGGHSLLPLMKLRLAVPDVLIDIGRLAELSYVRDEGSHVAVGALTTHDEMARSDVLAASAILRSATAARSAARWRTPIRRRICPRSRWPWTRPSSLAARVAAGRSRPGNSSVICSRRRCSRPSC
jgi:FAD binding domain in molybdopterin dehydrogenase